MLMWLAADDQQQPRGSAWVDWIPAFAVLASVVVAVIGGVVARWNWQKHPYEQLDTLMKVYKDWPEELEGKDTVALAIADRLAEIRLAADKAGQPQASEEEEAAEERVKARHARALLVMLAGAGALLAGMLIADWGSDLHQGWLHISGVGLGIAGAAVVTVTNMSAAPATLSGLFGASDYIAKAVVRKFMPADPPRSYQ